MIFLKLVRFELNKLINYIQEKKNYSTQSKYFTFRSGWAYWVHYLIIITRFEKIYNPNN